ncbi:MAG: T9SS type A sorting domain-containing protein [Bacteroidota bacterium]
MKKYFAFLLILLSVRFLFGTNYYVAKDGADSNEGSENAPFLTIAKAASRMVAGDSCFIKAGVYREVLEPQANGTANNPIVFTHFQDDEVIISATESASNWTLHQGNIYRTQLSMNLGGQNMVYVDGQPMDWARWPNNTDHDPYTVEAISVVSGSGSKIQSPEINNMNWRNGYLWYLGAHSGTSWTRKVTASRSGEISFEGVNINKWPFNPHNPTVLRNNNRGQFYLFGVLDALDYPEEWYYDERSSTLYLQAPANANPNNLEVEVGMRARTMLIDKAYIHVDGIHAYGGNIEITGEHCIIRNGRFSHCLNMLDELDNIDAQVPKGAIHVRASHTIIEHNIIDGSSLNGIFVQGWNNIINPTIRHNLIKNCNTLGIHASPIRSAASDNLIISNTLHTTGRDGIYCGGFNNEIAYNDVYDCMKINNDGGLFYTVGTDISRNSEIHHNWFHDSEGPTYADGRAAGIYLDNNSKGFKVHHNVVWNISWSGIQMNWNIWDNELYHNTLWNVSRAMGTWLKPEHSMQRIKVYNNVSNEVDWIGNDIQHNLILNNSPFIDFASQNFIPAATSVLIDSGLVIAGINDNFQGASPDAGAYEHGLDPWIPGVNSEEGGEITSINRNTYDPAFIKVFPNPLSNGRLSINIPPDLGNNAISIFNVQGQLIFQKELRDTDLQIESKVFGQKGLYLIKGQNEKLNWVKRLLVE